jgi:hypothetical protein
MTSSVSVVRAWERQVSHTSSPILTSFSDISSAAAAADRWGFGAEDSVPVRLDGDLRLFFRLLLWGRAAGVGSGR